MIRVEHLFKSFNGVPAVRDVNFEVQAGENLVLLGTSGCGKTTTLKMINRLITPDSGSVYINGQDVTRQSVQTLRRNLGFVLQNVGLFPHYTIAQNIAVVPGLLGWDKQKIATRVEELMHKLHLPPQQYAKAYPAQLSGGQQQRVGLARALAAFPPVLLMDEPFSALDPVTRKHIRQEFLQLDELKNKTIVLVTHDVQEAMDFGDQICLMDKGSIVQMGSIEAILFGPQQPFTRQFLQDQQFVLEMKAVPVARFWQYLEASSPALNPPFTFNASETIFQVLNKTLDQEREAGVFKIRHESGEVKTINYQALLRAFKAYKTNYH